MDFDREQREVTRARLRRGGWLDALEECKRAGRENGCERKIVVCTLLDSDTSRRLVPLYQNGPVLPEAKCSNIVGGCGCFHAEVKMLLDSGELARGATAVVTYSPCTPCANALIHVGVRRVVYGVFTEHDPKAVDRLRAATIEVWSEAELLEIA